MTSRNYIIALIAGALVLIGYLYWQTPATATAQLPAILLAVTGFAGILAKQGETEAKVVETAAKVDDNTVKTEQVHVIVNQQRTEMEAKIKELSILVTQLKTERTMIALEQKNIDANRPGLSE